MNGPERVRYIQPEITISIINVYKEVVNSKERKARLHLFKGDMSLSEYIYNHCSPEDKYVQERLNIVEHVLRKGKRDPYLLEWKGKQLPLKATLGEGKRELVFNPNYIVYDNTGREIGFWVKVIENGGKDQDEQKMVVYF